MLVAARVFGTLGASQGPHREDRLAPPAGVRLCYRSVWKFHGFGIRTVVLNATMNDIKFRMFRVDN